MADSSLLFRTFWDFFSNMFYSRLVKFMDLEGRLYLAPGYSEPHRPHIKAPLRKAAKGDIMFILRTGKLTIRVCAKPKDSFGIKEKNIMKLLKRARDHFTKHLHNANKKPRR